MKNDELTDLINSITLEVKDDVNCGNEELTKFKLPKKAQTEKVITAIKNNLSHYKNVYIEGEYICLEHPDMPE